MQINAYLKATAFQMKTPYQQKRYSQEHYFSYGRIDYTSPSSGYQIVGLSNTFIASKVSFPHFI